MNVHHKMNGHILKFLCIRFPSQAQIHFYTLMCVGMGESRRVRKRERICVCVSMQNTERKGQVLVCEYPT